MRRAYPLVLLCSVTDSLLRCSWPAFVRDDVWRGLLKAGIDWLNVDDLQGAAKL